MIAKNEDTCIYIIDDEYRIVSFNDPMKKTFPELKSGDICYKVLFGEDCVCKDCHLELDSKEKSTVFYNKKKNKWIEISSAIIDWPGKGKCSLVLTNDIHEGNKNLLYNLTKSSAYDELFELNITENKYKLMYHSEGKYIMPAENGKLSCLLRNVSRSMIHPDDRRIFDEFFNLETIMERIKNAAPNNTIKCQCRKRTIDGSYRWTLYTIIEIEHGVNSDDITMCFIQDISGQKNVEISSSGKEDKINNLTGLYNKETFFDKAESILRRKNDKEYCVIAIDIEHFKLFNEWYGRKVGDNLLNDIGKELKPIQNNGDGAAGYMGEDDFCIIIPQDDKAIESIQKNIINIVKNYGDNVGFLPIFGIYKASDKTISVKDMYDKALIAAMSVKGNYAKRYAVYNKNMSIKMEETQRILTEVRRGLKNGEFTFYAQPKCNMMTGKIISLESLARWNHPEKGLVFPDYFIPVLEKNGLITELDLYIWEEVCKSIRSWIDNGYNIVPISINVSRADIYSIDVPKTIKKLVEKYDIEPRLLEIEITESIYAEQYDTITEMVGKLRSYGFKVFMDDFGSGYSSLNMLKEVNVDVLKIDMRFLQMDETSSDKGIGILEAISSMARLLGLSVIVEGVETEKQMDILLNLGCIYGQGYYFYRPMPKEFFENLLRDENNIDLRGITARQMDRLSIKELFNDELFSDTLMNNILGGIAFYSVSGDNVEIIRVNEEYFKVTGTNPVDLEARKGNALQDVYKDDRKKTLEIFDDAYKNILSGADGDIRRKKDDGSIIWMHIRVFFLKEENDRKLYYGTISDVTERKLKEQILEESQKELSAVIGISENDASFMQLAEENRKAAAAMYSRMTPGGMIGGYCDDDFTLYFANSEMVRLLGYDNYDDFANGIDNKVINTIHPDDREIVFEAIRGKCYPGMEYEVKYRMPKKDGSWFWTQDKGRVVQAENGCMAIVSACMDISETMEIQKQITEKNHILMKQNKELNFLHNETTGGYHHCLDTDEWDFEYISNRFLEIFGYTREEIRQKFDNKYLNMVHPNDRNKVRRSVESVRGKKNEINTEYRMLSKKGYIWVIDQSRFMEIDGKRLIQGVVLDINSTVKLRDRMKMFLNYTKDDIVLLKFDGDICEYNVIANGICGKYGYSCEKYESMLNNGFFKEALDKEQYIKISEEFGKAIENREDFTGEIDVKLGQQNININLKARCMEENGKNTAYMLVLSDITSEKEKENELVIAERMLESALSHIDGGFLEWDVLNNRLYMSTDGELKSIGISADKEKGNMRIIENFPDCIFDAIPVNCQERIRANLRNIYTYHDNVFEIPLMKKNGNIIWIRSICKTAEKINGAPAKVVGCYMDITDKKKEESAALEAKRAIEFLELESIYSFKADLTNDKIKIENEDYSWFAQNGENSYSSNRSYVAENIVMPEYKELFLHFTDINRLMNMYASGIKLDSADYQCHKDGEIKWFKLLIQLEKDGESGNIIANVFIMDIDKQKNKELELTVMAHTDFLTGLSNRMFGVQKVKEYIKNMKDGESAAIIMYDMDNFKSVNNVFGHAYGDKIISMTAKKLKSFYGENDIACRIGGDEFFILCSNIGEEEMNRKMAEVIKDTVICDEEKNMSYTISAGYAMIPEDGKDFEELYMKADIALFEAKMDGKSSFKRYNSSMKAERYELINN